MGREQELDIGVADSLQAGDEFDQVRPVVGVDDADAAISEDIIAREQQVTHPQGELAGGMTGRAPDLQVLVAEPGSERPRRSSDRPCIAASGCGFPVRRSVHRSRTSSPFFDSSDALGMGGDDASEDLAGAGQPLDVVDVGVRGDDQLACGQAEIHLPDQLQDIGELVEESDVDQGELGSAVDQVDVDPQPPSVTGNSSPGRQERHNAAGSFGGRLL